MPILHFLLVYLYVCVRVYSELFQVGKGRKPWRIQQNTTICEYQ